jgi:hypothetical protein
MGRGQRLRDLVAIGFLAALTLAALGASAWFAGREVAFRLNSVGTLAEVVGFAGSSSGRGSGDTRFTYAPVFVFTLPDGTEQRAESRVGSSSPGLRVGDRIAVRYDPARPARAEMVGFLDSWGLAAIFGTFGALLGLGTFGGVLTLRAQARRREWDRRAATIATHDVPLAGLRRDGARWVIQARWSDTARGAQRLFESQPIAFDPEPQLRGIDTLRVTFDPNLPDGWFWMDLPFLRAPGTDAPAAEAPQGA